MIKIIGLTLVALGLFVVIATGVHAQTATPTTAPTATTAPTTTSAPTATPSPTGSVQGTSTVTVPSGAPATGFGR